MSSVVISGDTSGAITLSAPSVAGTNTITLPANTGTVITTASSGQVIPFGALPTGSVLQVVQGTYNASTVSTSSTSYVTTNLTVSITPKFSTSKVLVITTGIFRKGATNGFGSSLAIYRDSTAVYTGAYNELYGVSSENSAVATLNYLDSPASTSSIAYSLRFKTTSASNAQYFLPDAPNETGSIIVMEIAG